MADVRDIYRPCPACGMHLDRRRRALPWHYCTDYAKARAGWDEARRKR